MKKRVLILIVISLTFVLLGVFIFIRFNGMTGKIVSDNQLNCNFSSSAVFSSPTFLYGASGGDYYTYAPSIILDSGTERIWTCHNFNSSIIIDNIGYSEPNQALGKSVLAPGTTDSWDGYHTCDPSIVYGPFTYQGNTYDYAMFYLGYDKTQVKKNQIGIAFSNSLTNGGSWVKASNNPIIPYVDPISGNSWWGVGQPSAINVNGIIWLFYTVGDSYGTRIEYVTLDPKNPFILSSSKKVTIKGIKTIQGTDDWLNNADFAYIKDKDSFLIIRDKHLTNSVISEGVPNYISSAVEVAIIPKSEIETGTWITFGVINNSLSGFLRNHNAGIIRDKNGEAYLPNLDFIFTVSCAGNSCNNKIPEWSYDLYQIRAVVSCSENLSNQNVTCTNFTYSSWSACNSLELQTRTINSSSPSGCTGGLSILIRACNYTIQIDNTTNGPDPNYFVTYPGDEDISAQNINETNNINNISENQSTKEYKKLKLSEEQLSTVETFFIKLICKLSNLFNSEKYASCVNKY